jgi:High potential iron-sulfur protein
MKNTTRRVFVIQLAAASSALGVSALHAQATPPMVDGKEAQASALGYAADTTKVDPKKFPKHAADQKCSGCQLYTGKPKEASGPCALFAGKHVTANGWCSAYVKKA